MENKKYLYCSVIDGNVTQLTIAESDEIVCGYYICGKCSKLGGRKVVGPKSDCILDRQNFEDVFRRLTP